MRQIAFLVAFVASTYALATDIPKEFRGDWAPENASCRSKLKFRVEQNRVVLQNGAISQAFGNIDLCYSCEGGARYTGNVVWLTPGFNTNEPITFTAYFNAEETPGVTKLDIQNPKIAKAFPLNGIALRRCQ